MVYCYGMVYDDYWVKNGELSYNHPINWVYEIGYILMG